MSLLEIFWKLIEWPPANLLERSRLGRFVAGALAALAVLFVAYALLSPPSRLVASLLACASTALSLLSWKAGNWWAHREALRKAQEGTPQRSRRGFEVITTPHGTQRAPTAAAGSTKG